MFETANDNNNKKFLPELTKRNEETIKLFLMLMCDYPDLEPLINAYLKGIWKNLAEKERQNATFRK